MNRKQYLKALQLHVFPVLREAGFKGSGTNLRRINGPIVHAFNVQGSSGGQGCYINQGVHLLLLPKRFGGEYDLTKFSATDCLFRQRFNPGRTSMELHGRWTYGSTLEEMEDSAKQMRIKWEREGYQFFEEFTNYPEDFDSFIQRVNPENTSSNRLVDYAELAIVLEQYERSYEFAEAALENCSVRATGLKSTIKTLLKKINDIQNN